MTLKVVQSAFDVRNLTFFIEKKLHNQKTVYNFALVTFFNAHGRAILH